MARVTVEDCTEEVPDHFLLVLLSAHRARLISAGQAPTIEQKKEKRDKNPVLALREIAEKTINPADLTEDLIHSLQVHVEVDEPEEIGPPLLTTASSSKDDLEKELSFDHMTEEDLLRGLEGLVPPSDTEEELD